MTYAFVRARAVSPMTLPPHSIRVWLRCASAQPPMQFGQRLAVALFALLVLLAAVAPDLATETTPAGWRFADAPGRESRRARSWLGEDLDAWEEALADFEGTVAVSLAASAPVAGSPSSRRASDSGVATMTKSAPTAGPGSTVAVRESAGSGR